MKYLIVRLLLFSFFFLIILSYDFYEYYHLNHHYLIFVQIHQYNHYHCYYFHYLYSYSYDAAYCDNHHLLQNHQYHLYLYVYYLHNNSFLMMHVVDVDLEMMIDVVVYTRSHLSALFTLSLSETLQSRKTQTHTAIPENGYSRVETFSETRTTSWHFFTLKYCH